VENLFVWLEVKLRLIETVARCDVDGHAQDRVQANASGQDNLRVLPSYQHAEVRELLNRDRLGGGGVRLVEAGGHHMRLDVVHGDDGNVHLPAKLLGELDADIEAVLEAGPYGHSDSLEARVALPDVEVPQYLFRRLRQVDLVIPCRDVWDDPVVVHPLLPLGDLLVGLDLPKAVDQGGGRLVEGGLDPEDQAVLGPVGVAEHFVWGMKGLAVSVVVSSSLTGIEVGGETLSLKLGDVDVIEEASEAAAVEGLLVDKKRADLVLEVDGCPVAAHENVDLLHIGEELRRHLLLDRPRRLLVLQLRLVVLLAVERPFQLLELLLLLLKRGRRERAHQSAQWLLERGKHV